VLQAWHLERVARVIVAGGIIAYPTEAVFGLGCDPFNYRAVSRLLMLKRRSAKKGLIVIAATLPVIERLVCFPNAARRAEINRTWPGPVTWVMPARSSVPPWLTGDRRYLAVRVTGHPVAAALCQRVGVLVSTSANPAGCGPARDPARVRAYFNGAIDYFVSGRIGDEACVSEIRDGVSGRVLRPRHGRSTTDGCSGGA